MASLSHNESRVGTYVIKSPRSYPHKLMGGIIYVQQMLSVDSFLANNTQFAKSMD